MLGRTSFLQAVDRGRSSVVAIAATIALGVGLSALAPASAYASGCTDTWTNTAGGSWFEGANWSTKAPPTSTEEACITEAGTYTVEMAQKSTVTVKSLTIGGASGTQTLVVASTNSLNAVLTASSSITNGKHGAIILTNAETSGNNVTIAGSISNAGKITTEAAHGGQRNLQGNLTNIENGSLTVNANTSFNGAKAALTDKGPTSSINLASGVQLVASNESSVTNTSGTIAATGTGDVLMEPGTTFTEAAGTTTGSKPVVLRNAALKYTGSGESLITQHGEGGTLSGNLAAGQSLVLESTNTENVKSTASASFTNAGTITLTNSETSGNNATLAISSGTLTNSGTLTTEKAIGGQRNLQGSITNTGTLAINANTSYNGAKAALSNEGTIDLATEVRLTASSEGSVTNASGTIAATGTGDVLMEPGTTFTEGAGTTSGSKPVVVRDAALVYTGAGASLITQHGEGGTLSGNLSAGQSLVLESTNSENVKSVASASFSNAGTITLTNSETSGNNATLAISEGTLTNTGTIATEPAVGGQRNLSGNIANQGTLAIDANTAFNGAKAALTNEGTLEVAAGKQLVASNKSSVTNASGQIVAGEGADVLVEPEGAFTEGAGTTSGAKPVILRDAALAYTGSGESLITQHGEGSTLSGNLAAGQSLVLESTNSENVKSVASGGFTNAGSITLTNSETSGNNATLVISSGTLTNSGTITTELAHGGQRSLQGSITNTGTLAINANTSYNGAGAVLTNEGALTVAEGVALTVSANGSVANDAGNIATGATGHVLMEPATSFTEGAGTTSGTLPVIVRDAALAYTGTGASTIAQRGESGTLKGNLSSGQSLLIESTCSEHAKTTAAASFSNAGSIMLTNGDSCGNNATLAISSGTLSNSGTITTESAHGGQRNLQGSITNTGTLAINANTAYSATKAVLTNEGAINLAAGVALAVSGKATVNNNGGAIAATGNGALTESGGVFNQGLGKITGSKPVVLKSTALNYTGAGAGTIAVHGEGTTLKGAVNSGQVLSIQSTCSAHAKTTVTGNYTNFGTIDLTNGDSCGNNATLTLGGKTLTNKGTINSENPHGGARTIEGALTNEGTVALSAGETLKVTGAYTQVAEGTLKVRIASASSFGTLSVGGAATVAGTLIVSPVSPFVASLGQTFAILGSTSLTGTFATETGDQINSTGLYYKPTYSATGVTLVVTQASLSLSAESGLPGSVVTLSGSGYLPGDTITPAFTDHNKVKTTFPTVTTNSSGEFSTEITIPAGAALKGGSISVKSTQTGVNISKTFTVT